MKSCMRHLSPGCVVTLLPPTSLPPPSFPSSSIPIAQFQSTHTRVHLIRPATCFPPAPLVPLSTFLHPCSITTYLLDHISFSKFLLNPSPISLPLFHVPSSSWSCPFFPPSAFSTPTLFSFFFDSNRSISIHPHPCPPHSSRYLFPSRSIGTPFHIPPSLLHYYLSAGPHFLFQISFEPFSHFSSSVPCPILILVLPFFPPFRLLYTNPLFLLLRFQSLNFNPPTPVSTSFVPLPVSLPLHWYPFPHSSIPAPLLPICWTTFPFPNFF